MSLRLDGSSKSQRRASALDVREICELCNRVHFSVVHTAYMPFLLCKSELEANHKFK